MSTKVIFSGWNEGLKTIALMKLIRDLCSLRLNQAKKIVDDLLDNQQPFVILDEAKLVEQLVEKASKLGAIMRIE